MSFYCKVCTRMPIELINDAIKYAKEKIEIEKVEESNIKSKAKIFKLIFNDLALKADINLK